MTERGKCIGNDRFTGCCRVGQACFAPLARQGLDCANKVFGVEVNEYLNTLEDSSSTLERGELLGTLAPHAGFGTRSYGKL